jgi:hypothetical protein
MNHDKATEEFFRLRGWKQAEYDNYPWLVWEAPECPSRGTETRTGLPKICESMADWIKYVAEFMEGEGYEPTIGFLFGAEGQPRSNYQLGFRWANPIGLEIYPEYRSHTVIENHQILYASVLAANEYLKGRQNDKS